MAETSPENVFLNIDLGWATVGDGPDNVPALIGRVKDRIRLTHFKDFYDLNDRKKMVDDIKEVLGNEDGFKKITSIAYETARNNFIWKHRVNDMFDIIKEHCRI